MRSAHESLKTSQTERFQHLIEEHEFAEYLLHVGPLAQPVNR